MPFSWAVLAVTSITNVLLAAVTLSLALRISRRPKTRFSAAWYFSGVLFLLGLAALLGAIDHGYFETAGAPRYVIQRSTWIALGGVTFCLLMTTAQQFFARRAQRGFLIAGVIQFAANTIVVLRIDSFLDVILNYTPVMLLFLAMNIAGLKKGTGSAWIIAGIVTLFAASGIQAAGFDALSPVDHNGLYHLVSIVGVAFLYLGAVTLRND